MSLLSIYLSITATDYYFLDSLTWVIMKIFLNHGFDQ